MGWLETCSLFLLEPLAVYGMDGRGRLGTQLVGGVVEMPLSNFYLLLLLPLHFLQFACSGHCGCLMRYDE